MNREDYRNCLNDVYNSHFCSGQCAHFSKCKKGQIDDGLFFNRAKLGSKYGEDMVRKILVVGKEPIMENREITQPAPLDQAKNDHYRRTLYTLATIYDTQPNSDKISDLDDYKRFLDYFCLTNYFKCSFTETVKEDGEKKSKKNSGIDTSKVMKKECWKILIDEIDALKPEIIIIQGMSYSNAFWHKIEERYGKNRLRKREYKIGYEQLTKHDNGPGGGPLYIVWAYHPTARFPYSWNQRLENLQYVLDKLRELLRNKKAESET